jgi:hypothetical protein
MLAMHRWIKKAISDGAPEVEKILSQLRDDMDSVFSKEVVTAAKEKLATLVRAYNDDRAKLSFEQRTARLAEIRAAAAASAASVGSAPANLVSSMQDAFDQQRMFLARCH